MTEEVLAVQVSETECWTGCCVPVPLRFTVAGELVALLVMVTVPATVPVAAGAKVTFRVAVWPTPRICPLLTPPALKPGPAMLAPEIVTLAVPVLVRVTGRVLLLLTFTLPKAKVVGLGVSFSVAGAFTVKLALLLEVLPAELLTVTLNCDPESAVLVAGVV
jgi:hypothetical protein